MKYLDIEDIEDLKETLDSLEDREYLYLSDNGEDRYIVVPLKLLSQFNEMMGSFEENGGSGVKVIAPEPINLTYDEYEAIKKELNKVLDDTFKPNPEKLN